MKEMQMTGFYSTVVLSVVSESAVTASPKNSSEMQILGSYPRTTELETLEVDIYGNLNLSTPSS